MSNLYICIDCELTSSEAQPAPLNQHGMCATCGSSSVVPVDTLVELDRVAKKAAQARETTTDDTKARVQAMKIQRRKDAQPLVDWLQALLPSMSVAQGAELVRVLAQWDGWAWAFHYPWLVGGIDDNPLPGRFTLELINGSKNGPRWCIILDAKPVEVRTFHDGII